MVLFSVIIPLYNKEDYIENTLKSVFNQTYKNFEIIIINDGSTDKSVEKAEILLTDFKNFTIINQENKGLSSTRNKGISLAKGTIIALLDADDLWHENFLQSIYSLHQNFPEASFYGTDYLEYYGPKNIVETKKNINPNLKTKEFLITDFFEKNKFQSIICQSSMAFKKEITNTILFDEDINYGEDVDFYLKSFIIHKLAYNYTPLTTILTNIPNQITKVGIKNKTLPNLIEYEKNNPKHNSLVTYINYNRYMFAIQYKLIRDNQNFKNLTSQIDYSILTSKQKVLLKSPLFVLKGLKFIKKSFLKQNIRLTSFDNKIK